MTDLIGALTLYGKYKRKFEKGGTVPQFNLGGTPSFEPSPDDRAGKVREEANRQLEELFQQGKITVTQKDEAARMLAGSKTPEQVKAVLAKVNSKMSQGAATKQQSDVPKTASLKSNPGLMLLAGTYVNTLAPGFDIKQLTPAQLAEYNRLKQTN